MSMLLMEAANWLIIKTLFTQASLGVEASV